jgi:putative nucleotidyltransferase with HDIG domain
MNRKPHRYITTSRESELAVLIELISTTHTWTDTQAVLSTALEQAAKLAAADGAECHLVNSSGELQFTTQYNLEPDFVSGSLDIRFPLGTGIPGMALTNQKAFFIPDIEAEETYQRQNLAQKAFYRSLLCIPLSGMDSLLGTFTLYFRKRAQLTAGLRETVTAIGKQLGISIERAHLFQQTTEQLKELQILQTVANALNRSANIQEALERSLEAVITAMNMRCGWVVLLDGFQKNRLAASYNLPPELDPADWSAMRTHCRCIELLQLGKLDAAIKIVECQQLKRVTSPDYPYHSHASIPVRAGTKFLGNLNIVPPSGSAITIENYRLFNSIGDQIGVAIERARLYEQAKEQRTQEQQILLGHGQMLLGEHNLQTILDQTIKVVSDVLQVEYAALALVAPGGNVYSIKTELGFPSQKMQEAVDIPVTDNSAISLSIRTKTPIIIPDINLEKQLKTYITDHNIKLTSSLIVPMLMGAEALGGIAVYSQSPRQWSEDEIRLLSLLANQTAIAIENTRLFKAEHTIRKRAEALHLQTIKQAQDITLAYDATIEGWSHALDLRDKETEEHTLRVTNLTLQLAQAIGVSDSALIHIRRGALLHDIGKMGIPDNILRKSGALSDEEWSMMRQHPRLAYEMLSAIVYLLPALDIPYCHHEKWDGTGYPRGLKGEEIPLAARIFAIVDVFDALTSDRPYRPAWTTKEAVEHIHEQAGIHFDPQVANAFLRLIGDK